MGTVRGATSGTVVVRAVRFPTTVPALHRLGASDPTSIPFSFDVVADAAGMRLVGHRGSVVFLDVPSPRIGQIAVGETRSRAPFPQVELAIVVSVERGDAMVDLPIVPLSDDGKSSLKWKDAEVRRLASRLEAVIAR